jgi:twitching motility protein PilJ
MPSGKEKEYAKLYGQANTAYCQGNLEEAALILREMLARYPNDPNVILLQGHIHLGLQQHSLAQECYELVIRSANTPENSDLLDYARRGIEQIRQFRLDEDENNFAIAATEGITRNPISAGRGEFTDESDDGERWLSAPDSDSADWHNDSLDWDSGLFNEDDLDEPTLGQINPQHTAFAPTSTESRRRQVTPEMTDFSWSEASEPEETPFPFLDKSGLGDDDQAEDAFEDNEDMTFVVSSDLRRIPLNGRSHLETLGDGESTFAVPPDLAFPMPDGSFADGQRPAHTENLEDDLGGFNFNEDELSNLDLTSVASSLSDSDFFNRDINETLDGSVSGDLGTALPSRLTVTRERKETLLPKASDRLLKPTAEVDLGKLAFFLNAPLKKKQLLLAAIAGLTPIVMIFAVNTASWLSSTPAKTGAKTQPPARTGAKPQPRAAAPLALSPFSQPVLTMMFLAGGVSFLLTWLAGQLAIAQTQKTLNDLQTQFDSISEGDFNVKATIYSEDEFGQLSNRFNQMARVIATTTSDAQRRAAETEQAREDLQRQVIRLLDDVEGAARGDLTVEASVSADVLGAVADAFNLTIQNLREIVRQVKKAAKQVNQGSTDSESFARNQSSDALRMAEELAVTLNSVQMMTDSIQRVAENAREAEEVARTSSITALKGGESVERTVAGILQIRETVSETARKVKRLAEASQEISKIVALISQIASRTNLLALNASIQAARAGDAGRGFAIVADEVRQLADRSAKSLKEIEQIVLQIQSETGSVMTAMEEGIQQVIDVTERSEQAKKSLEDIIQVSNRIDTLVRSITADTVKQRENSKNVAQVMQSVELTAQETSQESQRVAGSLQKLVSISRDLLSSVERFKVDTEEAK